MPQSECPAGALFNGTFSGGKIRDVSVTRQGDSTRALLLTSHSRKISTPRTLPASSSSARLATKKSPSRASPCRTRKSGSWTMRTGPRTARQAGCLVWHIPFSLKLGMARMSRSMGTPATKTYLTHRCSRQCIHLALCLQFLAWPSIAPRQYRPRLQAGSSRLEGCRRLRLCTISQAHPSAVLVQPHN